MGRAANWALASALCLGPGLGLGAGCHHKLPRLTAAGEHAEVVARVAKSRYEPKGKAARAYAESLAALDRVDQARAVLSRDYRKTGQVESLLALADLEAAQGLLGLAIARYERVSSLDGQILEGRVDVCRLLQRRAARFLAQGEGLAADQDMRRAAELCPPRELGDAMPSADEASFDHALMAKARELAEQQAREQRTQIRCEGSRCEPTSGAERSAALGKALADARAAGPTALRAALTANAAQGTAEDVIALLRAELDGALGPDVVTDDEVRRWIGYTSRSELSSALASADAITNAYVRLRVNRLGMAYRLEDAGEAKGGSRAALMSQVLEGLAASKTPAKGWRVLVLLGDVSAAQLELTSGLRALTQTAEPAEAKTATQPGERSIATEPRPSVQAPAPTPSHGVAPPSHWAAKVPVSEDTMVELLVLARMRAARDREDEALEITRFTLAEARASGFAATDQLAMGEARRLLADGKPWQAVAVVDAVPGVVAESVERAAGSAIALAHVSCEDHCGVDEDRNVVERVLGEAWVKERADRLLEAALGRLAVNAPVGDCPTPAELLAGDASGSLADAMRAASEDLDAPGVADALRRSIESDMTLVCAGRYAVPLLQAGGYRQTAYNLGDALAQAPQMVAASQLALQAELAVVAGQGERAVLLVRAAASAASDPRAVWRRAQEFGRLAGDRDYEMLAIHEGLLHTPPDEAAGLRRDLVIRALLDAELGWVLKNMEIGRETLAQQVEEYLSEIPEAQRYAAREVLAKALTRERWSEDGVGAELQSVLWADPELLARHPASVASVYVATSGRSLGETDGITISVDSLKTEKMVLVLGAEREIPAITTTYCSDADLVSVRLRYSESSNNQSARRRTAIGLAVTAPEADRVAALERLLADVNAAGDDSRRAQIVGLLVAGLAAYPSTGAEPMVREPDALVRLALRLDDRPEESD